MGFIVFFLLIFFIVVLGIISYEPFHKKYKSSDKTDYNPKTSENKPTNKLKEYVLYLKSNHIVRLNKQDNISKDFYFDLDYKETIITSNIEEEERDYSKMIEWENRSEKTHCVYVIKNNLTNELYIGRSYNFNERINNHFDLEYQEKESNKLLYRKMKQYGIENFSFGLVLSDLSLPESMFLEAYLIRVYATRSSKCGYNVASEYKRLNYLRYFKQHKPEFLQKIYKINPYKIITKSNKSNYLN